MPQRSDELLRRDEAIAKLNDDLASLRATLQADRRDWRQQLAPLAHGRYAWRCRRLGPADRRCGHVAPAPCRSLRCGPNGVPAILSAPPSLEPDDHHFGEPISDHRVKLNLAQANMDLGKIEVAREILEEVRAAGGAAERQEAEALLGSP